MSDGELFVRINETVMHDKCIRPETSCIMTMLGYEAEIMGEVV